MLQNGKHDEAWMVLKQVHDTNMRAKGHPERVFSVRTPPPHTPIPTPPPPSCHLREKHPRGEGGRGAQLYNSGWGN